MSLQFFGNCLAYTSLIVFLIFCLIFCKSDENLIKTALEITVICWFSGLFIRDFKRKEDV